MNDPVAIAFVNQSVRPLAEKLRALNAEVDSFMAAWNNGVGAAINANLAAAVEDGREAEGVTRLTCNDVALLVTQVAAIKAQFDQAGVEGILEKPCVRPIQAS